MLNVGSGTGLDTVSPPQQPNMNPMMFGPYLAAMGGTGSLLQSLLGGGANPFEWPPPGQGRPPGGGRGGRGGLGRVDPPRVPRKPIPPPQKPGALQRSYYLRPLYGTQEVVGGYKPPMPAPPTRYIPFGG